MAKKRILLIDDEPDLLATTKFLLENEGYKVYTAGSGAEGIKKFEEISPDLILLDIVMPGMDGFETLHQLRNVYPDSEHIPIIMLTVRTEIESTFQAKGFGATDYITKSEKSDILLAKIKKIFHQSNSIDK